MSRSLRLVAVAALSLTLSAIGLTGTASASDIATLCIINHTHSKATLVVEYPKGIAHQSIGARGHGCIRVKTDTRHVAASVDVRFEGPAITDHWWWQVDPPSSREVWSEMGIRPDCKEMAVLPEIHASASFGCGALNGTVTWVSSHELRLNLEDRRR